VLLLIEQYLLPEASMTSAQAASLYGKCQWVLLHGRIGRSALSAIKDRQYRMTDTVEADTVSDRMKDSLFLLQHLLSGHLPPIEYQLDSRPNRRPVIILSDAMWQPTPGPHGFGRMAWMVWFPVGDIGGELLYASAEVDTSVLRWSNDLKPKQSFIVFLEVLALAAPYFSPDMAARLRGRDVIHFADNTSANAGVVKGVSPSPDCDRVIGNLHFRWAELRANVWVTYVASDANLSDDPSRRSSTLPDDTLEGMGARKVPFVLPDLRSKVRSQSEI